MNSKPESTIPIQGLTQFQRKEIDKNSSLSGVASGTQQNLNDKQALPADGLLQKQQVQSGDKINDLHGHLQTTGNMLDRGASSSDDDDHEEGQDESQYTDNKKKQKRRSKNDVQGRDHRCTFCEKTYLSYPALYTHMKNKHAKGPDGNPLIAFNSGRGRGRPKKNIIGSRSHVEPTSEDFFKTIDKVGGPLEPDLCFNDIYTEIFIKKNYAKQMQDQGDEISGDNEEEDEDDIGQKTNHNQTNNNDDDTENKRGEGDVSVDQSSELPVKDDNNNTIDAQMEESNQNQVSNNADQLNQKLSGDQNQANLINSPNLLQGHDGLPIEKVKKKRGRKPKSYYLEQARLQEIAREAEMKRHEINEIENEEEVLMRNSEFKSHPLFLILSQFTVELKEFIEEKRRQQNAQTMIKQACESNPIIMPSNPMNGIPGIGSSDMKIMPSYGNIFSTQKIFTNAVTFAHSMSQYGMKQQQQQPEQNQIAPVLAAPIKNDEPEKPEEESEQKQVAAENHDDDDEEDQEDQEDQDDQDDKHGNTFAGFQQQLQQTQQNETEDQRKEKEEELKKDERAFMFTQMTETEKDKLSCDEIFCMYLRQICKVVNEQTYQNCIRFVLLYRECLNEYGWLKRRDHFIKAGIYEQDEVVNNLKKLEKQDDDQNYTRQETIHEENKVEKKDEEDQASQGDVEMKQEDKVESSKQGSKSPQQKENSVSMEDQSEERKIEASLVDRSQDKDQPLQEGRETKNQLQEEEIYIPQAEYSAVCNADFLPIVCNEFVTEFLDKEHGACQLERTDAIDLTRNFCHWVFVNGLSCIHISLNN